MKILIIGGTGFIGKHLINELIDSNKLILLNRNTPNQENIKFIQADRREMPLLKSKFAKLQPEVIIDLIPYFAQDAWDLIHTFQGITKRIIVLSSGDVYRNYEIFKNNLDTVRQIASHENDLLRQDLFPYRNVDKDNYLLENYDKILVEKLLQAQNELDFTILRSGAIYGAFDSQGKLSEYIRPMINQENKLVINEQKAAWQWTRVFVKDLTHAIKLCIENESGARNQIFNIGEKNALTQLQLIKHLQNLTAWSGTIELTSEKKENVNYHQNLLLNTDKIRSFLNYREKFSLAEGLKETVAHELQEKDKL